MRSTTSRVRRRRSGSADGCTSTMPKTRRFRSKGSWLCTLTRKCPTGRRPRRPADGSALRRSSSRNITRRRNSALPTAFGSPGNRWAVFVSRLPCCPPLLHLPAKWSWANNRSTFCRARPRKILLPSVPTASRRSNHPNPHRCAQSPTRRFCREPDDRRTAGSKRICSNRQLKTSSDCARRPSPCR